MRGDTHDKEDWLDCPECESSKVNVEKTDGYEPSIIFECLSCGEQNGFWL